MTRGSTRAAARATFGALALLAAWVSAAAGAPPLEYLDEQTAATITVVSEPLVFSYERRELAANSRDYVTLAAAAVNRAGEVRYVLIGYIWSTIDSRVRQATPPDAESFHILADDRRIELKLIGHSPAAAGIGLHIHAPTGTTANPNVYASDLDTLRFLAAARRLVLVSDSGETSLPYALWSDRRPQLRELVRSLDGSTRHGR